MTGRPHDIPYRLSFNGALCSVKWVGNLDIWPDTLAFGVEWDDPKKGKHSGIYNEQQLFTTRVEGAGSFVKATRRKDRRTSCLEALRERYYTQDNALIPNPDVVDFEKFEQWDMHPARRTAISLSRLCVARSSLGMGPYVSSLEELDLSFNLFEDLSDVADIVRQCPCLTKLDLSGNRFKSLEVAENLATCLSQVKRLSMLSAGLTESDLFAIAELFINLEVLDISDNALEHINLPSWPSLRILIANRNNLTRLPDNLQFVRELRVCYNKMDKAISTEPNMCVELLDIRHNSLSDWSSLDDMSEKFPAVTDLYVHRVPLLDKFSEKMQAILIVAHWNRGLQRLNGTTISKEFRRHAEIYFIHEVMQGKLPPMEQYRTRWVEIKRDEGDAFHYAEKSSPAELPDKMIALTFIYGESSKSRQIPTFISVLKLKCILSRLFNLSTCRFDLIVENTDKDICKLDQDDERIEYYRLSTNATVKIDLNGVKLDGK